MPFLTPNSWFGLGVETVRGTGVTPTAYLPIKSPQWTPNITWLKDEGLRGSPAALYSNTAGVRHDGFDFKGDVFLDTFPHVLRGLLGTTDTTVAAPTATTLSSSAIAGATTVSTVATIAAGAAITIGSGATLEAHIATGVSGAGPYTVTLKTPLLYAQGSGAAVGGLTAHAIGLLNNPAVGSQPPSYTLVDFDAGAAGSTSARQLTAGQASELTLNFAIDASLNYDAKYVANPASTIAAPAESFTTELFVPAWANQIVIGGTTAVIVQSGDMTIKRTPEVIHTAGTQGPYRLWATGIDVEGKFTFVVEAGDTTITSGTSRLAQALHFSFTEPVSGHFLDMQMSQVQLKMPKITRGKQYVEVEAEFSAEANTTDAVGGGYSPLKAFIGNAQTTAY